MLKNNMKKKKDSTLVKLLASIVQKIVTRTDVEIDLHDYNI